MRGKAYTGNKRIRNRHSSKAIRVLGRVSAVVLLSVSLLLSNAETCLAANIGTGLLCIILLALAMPSIVFTFFIDKKYRNILKNE